MAGGAVAPSGIFVMSLKERWSAANRCVSLTLETLDAAEFHVRLPNVLMTSWMV